MFYFFVVYCSIIEVDGWIWLFKYDLVIYFRWKCICGIIKWFFFDCLLKLEWEDYKMEKEGLMENENCGM